MLTPQEKQMIYRHAYLPEHLCDYVEAITEAEASLHEGYLYFFRKKHLLLIGYPLTGDAPKIKVVYRRLRRRLKPATVALIAPQLWHRFGTGSGLTTDNYYRLRLPLKKMDSGVAYMVRRAAREVTIDQGSFDRNHQTLLEMFLDAHRFSARQRYLYQKIPDYLNRSRSALLLDARKENALVAFTVMDTGSEMNAFYLFNIRSMTDPVPGVSDLLFHEMVQIAQRAGKSAINLGLGVNNGIRRFKKKWGGMVYLSHQTVEMRNKIFDFQTFFADLCKSRE